MVSDIELLRYNESIQLPKFKVSLDKLLNKPTYDLILAVHSLTTEELPDFINKAISEGNAVLIQREYDSYMVILWKD